MFTALLDTCVLWPSLQRDFLLSLAVEGCYRPVWSDAILEELEECETRKSTKWGAAPQDARRRAVHLIDQMSRTFDDALVTGWEALDGTFDLPDPNDEHVAAAAVIANAGALVTENIGDFPAQSLPDRLQVLRPAEFALNTVAVSPQSAWRAIEAISARSNRPRRNPEMILKALATRYHMADVAELIRAVTP